MTDIPVVGLLVWVAIIVVTTVAATLWVFWPWPRLSPEARAFEKKYPWYEPDIEVFMAKKPAKPSLPPRQLYVPKKAAKKPAKRKARR